MKKSVLFLVMVMGALLSLDASGGKQAVQNAPSRAPAVGGSAPTPAKLNYGQMPLQFIPNRGQAAGGVSFYVQGSDKSVFFTKSGLTFELGSGPSRRSALKLDFVNANKDVVPVGMERSGGVISYFKGVPQDWKTGIPAFSRIIYRELWPGIDLIYSGSVNRMKYEFVVRPGADPARIRLAYSGAQSIRMTGQGRLAVDTPLGGFQDDVPVAFQDVDGRKVEVPVKYAIDPVLAESRHAGADGQPVVYGFRIGEYDKSKTLILDPAVLVNCGFIGGSGTDIAHGIAVDGEGNIYVAGETSSTDLNLPDVVGPHSTYGGGDSDAFVAKLNPEGTALAYCAYVGGSGKDRAAGLAVDSESSVYIAGTTDSPEMSFPVIVGPELTYNGGGSDAFVAKLSPDGNALIYCGYIGGAGTDSATSIAWVMEGDWGTQLPVAFIAGSTSSTETTFPVTVGPDLTYNGGESDAFIAKLKADGSGIDSCGYVGGSGRDEARKFAACGFGWLGIINAYLCVVGTTASTEATFPVVRGPDLTYNGGESDAFIAQIKTDWTGLEFCGYIGGAGTDIATDLVVLVSGGGGEWPPFSPPEFFVTGSTSSTEATFPAAVGPELTYNGGESDCFVAYLGLPIEGSSMLINCGYVGGAGSDAGAGIMRTNNGIYVIGNTSSTEFTFPAAYGSDMTYNGGASDIFVAKLASDWKGIASCGYLGGAGMDKAEGLAFSSDGDVLIAGSTDSSESTFPVAGGPDLTYHGGASDVFVARIHMKGPTLGSLSRSSAVAGDPGFTLTVTGTDFMDGAHVRWTGQGLSTTFVSDTELKATIDAASLALPSYGYISIENPDRESSDSLGFEVRPGPLTLASLSPTHALAGGSGLVLTLQGSGFVPLGSRDGYTFYGPEVLWNGLSKDSYYVSYTELQVSVLEGDIAAGGEVQVVVKGYAQDIADSNPLVFPVSTFAMAPSPATRAVTAGQSATYTVQLTPQFGSFDSEVSLTYSGLPDKCTAAFSPAKITPGGSSVSSTLTLKTTAPTASAAASTIGPSGLDALVSRLLLIVLLVTGWLFVRHPIPGARRLRWLAGVAAICLVVLISACSIEDTRHDPGTPAGTYKISVKATSGSLAVISSVELVVK